MSAGPCSQLCNNAMLETAQMYPSWCVCRQPVAHPHKYPCSSPDSRGARCLLHCRWALGTSWWGTEATRHPDRTLRDPRVQKVQKRRMHEAEHRRVERGGGGGPQQSARGSLGAESSKTGCVRAMPLVEPVPLLCHMLKGKMPRNVRPALISEENGKQPVLLYWEIRLQSWQLTVTG